MTNTTLLRTDSDNPDFQKLVVLLDKDLAIRDGEEHAFYAQYNKINAIKHTVVAYKNNLAVGCGAIKPYTDQTTEVKRMFVLPEYRGQGIAGEILRELEQWAKELAFAECILETGKKQPEAIRLYQKSGYSLIPNYGQYVGVENSVCMLKKLTA
ncbi:GNAT family N-acetyltransferase [Adhaeribacter radiodurans]|uniref:GNAT family N-acetyltransferase n=1 Tax=Adhaeribacter radiodurans TaxID=2745197 RepID=A0A7L7LFD5_9BACT|nr:GNAT family N-acetyltransferase [Adhaeribacter radiodurans]QMU31225.1 GNAT family N-acetyltransferase [Adhaeribacter radiodurans]